MIIITRSRLIKLDLIYSFFNFLHALYLGTTYITTTNYSVQYFFKLKIYCTLDTVVPPSPQRDVPRSPVDAADHRLY